MAKHRPPVYEFGPFRLDIAEHRLSRGGRPVRLTCKVFDLLTLLVRHSGHLISKDELLRAVWADSIVEENNLTVSMSALRKALGEKGAKRRYIETVHKIGYRFVAEVREGGGAKSAGGRTGCRRDAAR
jgi:DNA-binding winged helix-turn-helix (wHTH) protein